MSDSSKHDTLPGKHLIQPARAAGGSDITLQRVHPVRVDICSQGDQANGEAAV
jgi:hypothetical protein